MAKVLDSIKTTFSQAEVDALVAAKVAEAMAGRPVTFKVSAKGAVSVYGLGQWPTTLYKSQWDRLLPEVGKLQAFIKANEGSLSLGKAAAPTA